MTASVRALREGQTHYVDVPGIGPLREALAAYLRETIGANYDSSQVLVTAGVQESRFLTLQKIGEQFERVAMPAVVHPGARRALGTRPLALSEMDVDEANGYLPTLEAMRQALADGIRLLYLESPSRLTGKAYGAADVDRLADFLNEFDAGLILDQGLAPWIAGGYQSPAAAQRAPDNVAVLGEAWPGMGLTSWFIAYIATPEKWFEPMRSQKQIMAICTSTASQYAALESGRRYEKDHPAQLAQLEQNRARAAELAQAAGLVPLAGEANAVLALRCAAAEKADVLTALREAGYEVADGAGFGAADVVRLAVSLDETTTTALQSLN
jgi:aspartate/methionine/tyrosine aminotransferase